MECQLVLLLRGVLDRRDLSLPSGQPHFKGEPEAPRSWLIQGDLGRSETPSQVHPSLGSSLHSSCDSSLSLDLTLYMGKLLSAFWLPREVNFLCVWADSLVKGSLGSLQKRGAENMTMQHTGLRTITGTFLEEEEPACAIGVWGNGTD